MIDLPIERPLLIVSDPFFKISDSITNKSLRELIDSSHHDKPAVDWVYLSDMQPIDFKYISAYATERNVRVIGDYFNVTSLAKRLNNKSFFAIGHAEKIASNIKIFRDFFDISSQLGFQFVPSVSSYQHWQFIRDLLEEYNEKINVPFLDIGTLNNGTERRFSCPKIPDEDLTRLMEDIDYPFIISGGVRPYFYEPKPGETNILYLEDAIKKYASKYLVGVMMGSPISKSTNPKNSALLARIELNYLFEQYIKN